MSKIHFPLSALLCSYLPLSLQLLVAGAKNPFDADSFMCAHCAKSLFDCLVRSQATYQNERWTGRKAPRGEMAQAICAHFGPDSGLSNVLAHEMQNMI